MVKTHKYSRFALYTLTQIRDCKDVVMQIEDTDSKFADGQKCYLCEVVSEYAYNEQPFIQDIMTENIKLNEERRKLENQVRRLEKRLSRLERSVRGNENLQS